MTDNELKGLFLILKIFCLIFNFFLFKGKLSSFYVIYLFSFSSAVEEGEKSSIFSIKVVLFNNFHMLFQKQSYMYLLQKI